MNINYDLNPKSTDTQYQIRWNVGIYATPKTNVENMNDFREAKHIINKIKTKIKNS